jgi:hypothetical protein
MREYNQTRQILANPLPVPLGWWFGVVSRWKRKTHFWKRDGNEISSLGNEKGYFDAIFVSSRFQI